MGRTLPTFRQLIDDAIARWSKFRRALRREDQEYLDRLFRRVRSYTQAATYQASDNPMEAILLSIALDHEKRLDVLERTVHTPELSADSTLTLDAPSQSGPGNLPEAPVASAFALNAPSEPCSPHQKTLEPLDVPRRTDKNEQPGAHPQPDTPQPPGPCRQGDKDRQRNPARGPGADQQPHTTPWLDFRSLPDSPRDEAVADRTEPETPPVD
jgi:hypothetical protein